MIIFNNYLTPRLVLSHIWLVPLIFRAIACKLTICLSQGNRSHQVETTWHASSTAVCWCSGGLCFAATAKRVHRLGLETIWTHMKTGLRCTKAETFDQRCLQGCWFCVRKGWTCTWFCQQHSHHKPFHYIFQFMTIVIPMSPLWYVKNHQKTSVFSDFQVKKNTGTKSLKPIRWGVQLQAKVTICNNACDNISNVSGIDWKMYCSCLWYLGTLWMKVWSLKGFMEVKQWIEEYGSIWVGIWNHIIIDLYRSCTVTVCDSYMIGISGEPISHAFWVFVWGFVLLIFRTQKTPGNLTKGVATFHGSSSLPSVRFVRISSTRTGSEI